MLVSDFDYELPSELIAQESLADRAASRMLHLNRHSGALDDRAFRDFADLLRPDDLVVFNNTRVFPARLFGRRSGARAQPLRPHNPASRDFLTGRVEVLLTNPAGPARSTGRQGLSRGPEHSTGGHGFSRAESDAQRRGALAPAAQSEIGNRQSAIWNALVRPGRKIGVGERLSFSDELHAEVIARGEFGERTLRFDPVPDFFAAVERVGHVPLPPYIARQDRGADRERYQTVYAKERGSVAAPTAGLHFTPEVLERMHARGIETAEITLHVGLGTFQPVHVEVVEEHKLHREWYRISSEAAEAIHRALQERRRVVAIGTTTVRTLEYAAQRAAAADGRRSTDSGGVDGRPGGGAGAYQVVEAGAGEADIFIYPGFEFRVVGALLTNFHLPKSTLLMLVSAFAGRERVLAAYRHAVQQRYRFYSYGDCMFIE